MDSPEKQETESVSTEDLIANTYDELDTGGDEIPETEIDFEAETEKAAEGSDETELETETVVEATEEVEPELQAEVKEAAESDYNEPAPERWPDEIKDVYNALPPPARKAMLDGIYKPMQRKYMESTQELTAMRNNVQPMIESLEQHRNTFERMGVNPVEAFRTQVAWAAHLHSVGAEQGLQDMAQAYGVGTPKAAGQEEYLTPTERAMKEQITALQGQVDGQMQQTQQTTQQQRDDALKAQQQQIRNDLNTFINEKTDDGKPAHPHVEKVASNIAGIIKGGLVNKVDEYGQPVPLITQISQAYSMACNLDPALRTPLPDKRQVERVKTAQKVGVVTKSPATNVPASDGMSTSQFIEKTWDELDRKSA